MLKSKEYLESPSRRLRYIRSLLGVSRADLERKYGVSQTTIKSWEYGTVKITQEAINRCLSMYRAEGMILSREWILEGVGLEPKTSCSVANYFSSLEEKNLLPPDHRNPQQADELLALSDADLFKKNEDHRVVMMVCSDEMMPFYSAGDLVGGRLRYNEQIQEGVNRNCVVVVEGGIQFFRRVIRNSNGGYNLVLLNPNRTTQEPVMFDVPIVALAPVIWHRLRDC
jgi:transcriptional regulator with XRE-family HTH domain